MTKKKLHTDIEKILFSNKKYFESCVKTAEKLFEEGLYEDCINYIEKTASFGWFNFSCYYKCEKLEILLAKIQQKILPDFFQQKKHGKTNKILHICSVVYTSGGHSKLLYNWIKNDTSKKHTVLSTRLSLEELQEVSHFHLGDFEGLEQISVQASSKIESVNLLNQLPLNDYEAIILHIHPDETITNIVLSQKDIITPVCLVNHADHVFWLGTSIVDILLQIRESNISIDTDRRGIAPERQFFLPIPVENSSNINDGNTSSTLQILSTGTAYKYKPTENYNFLQEAHKIVEKHPNVIFNIVGISPDTWYIKDFHHERIVLHGIISSTELASLEEKTHIYVEGFPMASFTALLQAALRKIPFVLHYRPLLLFKLFSENKENAIIYPNNLEQWHDMMDRLILDKKYRAETLENQYQYILNNFSIDVWKSRINNLYEIISRQSHSFWTTGPDKYYHDENEKLLVTIDKRKFSHYSFTEKMSLKGRYFVYRMAKSKNINIDYLERKEVLKYLLNKA
ncbi:hypothetical protein ODZ84_15745 [Chryseobacterium fluminis]|uniref:hypothetical protein n=1 Tax=Chryseobacterium fluminis TaxID=2983606 RepID=UPI002253CC67|nr:hypothetical protein [Chryseobacterium sp. MMS21-Ot14]UZT96669.1 hypothetical protein ODZ84_15745 [Chryseobacterium sp. MMS21-Ot14]